jgi:hypothetical protein
VAPCKVLGGANGLAASRRETGPRASGAGELQWPRVGSDVRADGLARLVPLGVPRRLSSRASEGAQGVGVPLAHVAKRGATTARPGKAIGPGYPPISNHAYRRPW